MKNFLRSIGILVGVVSTVISGAAAAPPATTFKIVNSGSDLCLERNGDGWGEPLLQQPCNDSDAQRWGASRATQSDTTTRYLIIGHLSPNLCLDVRDGVNADRTIVQQWDCDMRAPSMRWQFSTLVPDRFFKLIPEIGSLCLDVAGGSLQPGAPIQIYSCTEDNTNTAQIWETRVE
jgi:Ricin-type beta-trefoil lectin domain